MPYFYSSDLAHIRGKHVEAELFFRQGLILHSNELQNCELLDDVWRKSFVSRIINSCIHIQDFALALFYIQAQIPIDYVLAAKCIALARINDCYTGANICGNSKMNIFWDTKLISLMSKLDIGVLNRDDDFGLAQAMFLARCRKI